MVRWAWRLFRREWRQQLLILLLIVVAVAAVVVGAAVAVNTPPPRDAGFGTARDLATFNLSTPTAKSPGVTLPHVQAQIAAAGASLRPGPGHRERDLQRSRLQPDLSAPVPGPARALRRADAAAALGELPDRCRPGRRHPRPGVRAQPLGGRHVAAGRQDRRRHRPEPAEPAGRVRAGPARAGDAPGPRSASSSTPPPSAAKDLPSYVTTAGSATTQRHQPVDHRAGPGDRRHAADRPGVDRWLHRAGPAPHAIPRDARVDGGDRPQCPARPGGERCHRRRRGRRPGLRARTGASGWPTARTTNRARTTSSARSHCRGT